MSYTSHGPVSDTCQIVDHGDFCGKPTSYWYLTIGGRTMALCLEHARIHRPGAGNGTSEEGPKKTEK